MKKRISGLLLVVCITLSMLPVAFASGSTIYVSSAGNDSNNGATTSTAVKTIDRALALVSDGDTICILDSADSTQPQTNIPLYIDKKVTIKGGTLTPNTLTLNYAGIVLGADVTFDGVELAFANRVRNAIMANGHTLTLKDTVKSDTVKNTVHLFCGGLTGYAGFSKDAGSSGEIIIQGSTALGNIYVGSISADGNANEWSKPSVITFDSSFTGNSGQIYACGALETYVSDDNMLDPDYVVPAPVASAGTFCAISGVTINLTNKTVVVDGATGGSSNAAVNYVAAGSNPAVHTLTNIGALTLSGTNPILIPAKNSTIDNGASVTVPSGARLELTNLTNATAADDLTIGSLSGGGTLVLGSDQTLTITGAVTGETGVAIGGVGYDGNSTTSFSEDTVYITTGAEISGSFVALSEGYVLESNDGRWTAAVTEISETRPVKFTISQEDCELTISEMEGGITVGAVCEKQNDADFLTDIPLTITISKDGADAVTAVREYNPAIGYLYSPVLGIAISTEEPEEGETGLAISFYTDDEAIPVAAGKYAITIAAPLASGEMASTEFTLTVTEDPVVTYAVVIAETTNGTVTADKAEAAAGETVALTVTPAANYMLESLAVTGANSSAVTVTDNSFTMPASAVTVTAVFAPCSHSGGKATYTNGFRDCCGEYQSAALNNGIYEISNAGQLYWFAAQVNGGNTAINGKLTADIVVNSNVLAADGTLNGDGSAFCVWTPIGTNYTSAYAGTFDGGSHTISGLYFNDSTADYVGLFGYVKLGGQVQNVGVVNSYFSGEDFVGAIAGYNDGAVQNCYNTGTVTGNTNVGGVVGTNGSNGYICNCYNTGTVSGTQDVGGVVGLQNNGNISNCYNTGTVSGITNVGGVAGDASGFIRTSYNIGTVVGRGDVGGVVGYYGGGGTINSCYYLTGCAKDINGNAQNGIGNSNDEGVTACADFSTGEVAYRLRDFDENTGGGFPSGNWGQDIGTDASPVLGGKQVYYGYLSCASDAERVYTNDSSASDTRPGHSGGTATCTTPAVCDNCGVSYGEKDTTNHDSTVAYVGGFCPNGCYEPAKYNEETGYYEIVNAGQLYWFMEHVNSGNGNEKSNAILLENIDLNPGYTFTMNGIDELVVKNGETVVTNGWREWFPIGYYFDRDDDSEPEPVFFEGIFDGNNKTVSGLYFYNPEQSGAGLFGRVQKGATVKNVGVTNSCVYGFAAIGGVVGENLGTVENCYHTGTIRSVGHENAKYIGGVVGDNNGGTVQNCYNTGHLISTANYVGGVVGYTFNGTVQNCYYLNTCGAAGEGTSMTADQFKSGEVAYRLNGSTSEGNLVWGQTLNADAYPGFTGRTVYCGYRGCSEEGKFYTNKPEEATEKAPHTYDNSNNSTCTVCGATCDHTGSDHTTATDNGNGTHTGTYSCCGGIVTENHDYGESHICVCGAIETFTVHWAGIAPTCLPTGAAVATFRQDFVVDIPENTHLEIEGISNKNTGGAIPYTYENGKLTIAADNIPAADIEIICFHYVEAKYDANGGVIKPEEGYENDDGFASDGSYWILKIQVGGDVCPENLNTVTREGYTFVDWRDASGKVYPESEAGGATIVAATTDVVIYAQWQCNHTIGGVEFRDNGNGTHSGYCGECDEPLGHYVERPHDHTNGKCVCGRKATPAVTAPTANTLTYTGEAQTLIAAGSTTGGTLWYKVNDGEWSTTAPSATNADSYAVYYKVVGNENYEDVAAQSVTVTVTPMNVSGATVTLGTALTYTGTEQTQTIASVVVNGLNLTAGDYTVTGNQQTGAGDYTLTITGKGNFTDTVTADWSINKASMTITADNVTVLVGRDVPAEAALIYTVTGLVNGETADDALTKKPTLSYAETPDTTQEGSYTINISGAEAANYTITYVTGTLTVSEKIPVTITVNVPANLVYDGTDQSDRIKANITAVDAATGGEVTVAGYEYQFSADPINAGSYTLTVSVVDSDEQYVGSVNVSFTIAKRSLTLKADNKSVYVNDCEPEYTVTVTGLVTGHSLSGAVADCADADMTKAGTYDITISTAELVIKNGETNETANYAVTTEKGTLTIREYSLPVIPTPTPTPDSEPEETVTVPVTDEESTVEMEVTVTEGKATVEDMDPETLEKVVDGDSSTVTIDFSELDKKITEVELPREVIEKIAEAAGESEQTLKIVLSGGLSIEFNASTLNKQVHKTDGTSLTVSIIPHEDAKLSHDQKTAVGDRPAYDINVTSGGKSISNMGGKITVTVPYELRNGEKGSGLVVYYVDDHGKRERCDTHYDAKTKRLSWQTDHLSLYMLDYDEKQVEACDGGEYCPINAFTDTDSKAWYHNGVHYCIENDLMNGVSDVLFAPNGTTTRAQIVTILWRLEGKPVVNYLMRFEDVASESWYTEAVRWAASENIVGGYGNGKFGPNDPITRQQMAAILYRYCQYKDIDVSVGEDTNILSYSDAFSISEWAIPAMQWACGSGMIQGIADGSGMKLDPSGSATRAQIATILWRFRETITVN